MTLLLDPDMCGARPLSLTPMTSTRVVSAILGREPGSGFAIANLNLHGLFLFLRDPEFARYTSTARFTLVDGWPVQVLAGLTHGRFVGVSERIGSTDWLSDLLGRNLPLTITAVGGTAEASALARARVQRDHPEVEWLAFDGFDFTAPVGQPDRSLEAAVLRSDLVLVGLGMPIQERWILENRALLGGTVVANVGGCIDYLAGVQRLAPRWTGRCGLEWAFRLAMSPRRLGYRYTVEPLLLAGLLMGLAVQEVGRTVSRRYRSGRSIPTPSK